MENFYRCEFTFRTEHTDLTGRGTTWGMLCAMQTAADVNARQLGCCRDQMVPRGYYWVNARTRLDMERYPQFDETITVTTWPGVPRRLIYPRYFRFDDADGQPLGCATAFYILLDNENHAPVMSSKVDIYPPGLDVLPQENPQPEKLRFEDVPGTTVFRTPVFSDIDCNRHMNNTRYVQWVCDLFPTSRFEHAAFKKFQINYIADGIEGRRIALSLYEDKETGCFSVRGADQETGRVIFEAAGEWMAEFRE